MRKLFKIISLAFLICCWMLGCDGFRDAANKAVDNAQACANKIADAKFAGPTCDIAQSKVDDLLANDPVCKGVPPVDVCKLPDL